MAGTTKENPRYNVVSTRLGDKELEDTQKLVKKAKKTPTEYVREAVLEKNERERGKNEVSKV